jgi:hypothetical protein
MLIRLLFCLYKDKEDHVAQQFSPVPPVPPASSAQAGSTRRFFYHWFRRETVVRAVKVACIVGPTLTLINQYDVLLTMDFSFRLFAKIALTFFVPYSVSSFSSAQAYMDKET